MLNDPHVNFVVEVIEIEGDHPGIHHVGLQVDDSEELHKIRDTLKEAEAPLLEIGETVCCFSKSEKNWTLKRYRKKLKKLGKAISEIGYTFQSLPLNISQYIFLDLLVPSNQPNLKSHFFVIKYQCRF